MTTQLQLDREGWLIEAANFILDDILHPAGYNRPDKRQFRVSVGFPSNRASTRKSSTILASCWKAAASADGHNEIFVSPIVDDSLAILDSLAHELIHYLDDCESGHRGFFAQAARAIDLQGPLTSTHAGQQLTQQLQDIISTLGPIPHAKLNPAKSGGRKQPTRMLKVECRINGCGFLFRTTQKHVDALDDESPCPACHATGTLELG